MKDSLLRVGLIGSIVTAVCCFTPILVWGFGAVGLISVASYADFALLPILGLFLAITAFALWRRTRRI